MRAPADAVLSLTVVENVETKADVSNEINVVNVGAFFKNALPRCQESHNEQLAFALLSTQVYWILILIFLRPLFRGFAVVRIPFDGL